MIDLTLCSPAPDSVVRQSSGHMQASHVEGSEGHRHRVLQNWVHSICTIATKGRESDDAAAAADGDGDDHYSSSDRHDVASVTQCYY
jgi:hypothetical protein